MFSFGEMLKGFREKAGMTQSQLADASGVPVWTLRGYEQNRRDPSWRVALKLASVLGVKIEDFAECLEKENATPETIKGREKDTSAVLARIESLACAMDKLREELAELHKAVDANHQTD